MSLESGPENVSQYEVGHAVVYGTRLWEIKNIEGDEAEIYAPERSDDLPERIWPFTPTELAEKYGGILVDTKIVFPEETKRVKLSELKPRSSITA